MLWAKTILLVIQFYIHSASIFGKGEMVIDAASLDMLCLARMVVFMGCQILSFCSPITLIPFHCPSLLSKHFGVLQMFDRKCLAQVKK